MTIDDVITDILEREGGFVDDPDDKGGATNMGITAATLGAYRKLGRPATVDEVRKLQEPEARGIYFARYVRDPGFEDLPEWVLPVVVDDGVLSGQTTAARTLQRAVGVTVDGVIGPATKAAVERADQRRTVKRIVVERVLRYVHIIVANPSQLKFAHGWISRSISFL